LDDATILKERLRQNALKIYSIEAIVDKYMSCLEELINIPVLTLRFQEAVNQGYLHSILEEIILQSKVEFNYPEMPETE